MPRCFSSRNVAGELVMPAGAQCAVRVPLLQAHRGSRLSQMIVDYLHVGCPLLPRAQQADQRWSICAC
jgi:hypothetical protein